jgi:hypothetical protein
LPRRNYRGQQTTSFVEGFVTVATPDVRNMLLSEVWPKVLDL